MCVSALLGQPKIEGLSTWYHGDSPRAVDLQLETRTVVQGPLYVVLRIVYHGQVFNLVELDQTMEKALEVTV